MSSVSSGLIHIIDSLEEGSFEEALGQADQVIQNNHKNFWGWYLGAVALAFLQDKPSFAFYLKKASQILPNSSYVRYLRAYLHILEDKEADAVVELAGLVDDSNGWFAHKLLEKIRSGRSLHRSVERGDVGKFVLLPDLRSKLTSLANEEMKPISKTRNFGVFSKKWMKSFLSLFFIISGVIAALFVLYRQKIILLRSPNVKWQDMNISSHIKILSQISPRNFLHTYKNSQEIIADFDEAKSQLKEKKVNQTRYLLQKIFNSNADFQTKEKCKIFLGFIPELSVEEFNDPVYPDQLIKEPEYRKDSQILWEGQVYSNRVRENGRQLEVLVRHNNTDFIINAFMMLEESDQHWKPYKKYREVKKQEKESKLTNAAFLGKFKGLIGAQKRIYIELDRLWL